LVIRISGKNRINTELHAPGGTMSKLSLNQKFGYMFGSVYLLVGLVGFAITGVSNFAAKSTGKELIFFELNPLHNIVHILIGVALLLAARTPMSSRMVNILIGAVYLLVGVIGLFIANNTSSLNILALNQPDNGLHLATAVLALGIAMSEKPAMAGRPA